MKRAAVVALNTFREAVRDLVLYSLVFFALVMIAAAILLSTFVSALGTRYVGLDGPTEESAWLVDRLTGHVYRCEAPHRGKANCDAEIATGRIGERLDLRQPRS